VARAVAGCRDVLDLHKMPALRKYEAFTEVLAKKTFLCLVISSFARLARGIEAE
jgi:hypothetical protein